MFYTYILTNQSNSVMYIGVTNDIKRRLSEHKNERIAGFTKNYHLHKLVYYEAYSDVNFAIKREKVLKGWKRERKNRLVETLNPNWLDLSEGWFG